MISLLGFLLAIPVVSAVLGYPPAITYFDGNDNMNQCATRLERRILGNSGVIFSHSLYGRSPYNASRNCFMMLVAPPGYRIRLKALEFDVNGHISNCDKDTLHVFDHEAPLDPSLPHHPSPLDDSSSPGPIIGQFCGSVNNRSELSRSSHNAMTLWWHSNPNLPAGHKAAGFKLLWTAYRDEDSGPCSSSREFSCGTGECIPIELACDHYANCRDSSDNLPRSRSIANCENLDVDPLSSLSGASILLVSGGIVLSMICLCGALCICCRACRTTPTAAKGTDLPSACYPQPSPPQFYPPSPPKIPLPIAANRTAYTPRRQIQFDPTPISADGYRTVRLANDYGSPLDNQNEYTYVRNDIHRNLL